MSNRPSPKWAWATLVSFLDDKGRPNIVDRALIYPPQSRLAALSAAERDGFIKQSTIFGQYEKAVDRDSAYEMLKARAPQNETTAPRDQAWQAGAGSLLDAFGKSAARAIGSQVGREIMRGVLGSLFGTTTRRTRR